MATFLFMFASSRGPANIAFISNTLWIKELRQPTFQLFFISLYLRQPNWNVPTTVMRVGLIIYDFLFVFEINIFNLLGGEMWNIDDDV